MEVDQEKLTSIGDKGLYRWVEMLQLRTVNATHLRFMESKLRKAKAKVDFDSLYRRVASADEEVKKLTSSYLRVAG